MFYYSKYQKKAHEEVEMIFRILLPAHGLNVREEQIQLCHQMLDALLFGKIALCDAGVGIGKTYAYLAASIIKRKYAVVMGRSTLCDDRPVVISTSSIALQKAITWEYIPFLSDVLLQKELIEAPIQAVVRKGKEHFVCDARLSQRVEAVRDKAKNELQKKALLSLCQQYDMDEVHGLSGYDRRHVCVPKFCPRDCPGRNDCRYQQYLQQAKGSEVSIQICNHNYLLADSAHRERGYRPLLSDYRVLIIDEAHKLPDAARQMYGKTLGDEDMREMVHFLEGEHQGSDAARLKEVFRQIIESLKEIMTEESADKNSFFLSEESRPVFAAGMIQIQRTLAKLRGILPHWVYNRLEEAEVLLDLFYRQDENYILYLQQDRNQLPVLCATSKKVPKLLKDTLWDRGIPAILTSGTLMAGNGFERTKQVTGLLDIKQVQEYVARSPFEYRKNCLLYLPGTVKQVKKGSREEAGMVARHIQSLIGSTYGHTLVLFTSYSLMGSVRQLLRDSLPFPVLEVWRHSQEEITRFKTLKNAVLFAAGSCWEGVDFPGDMVSSLIIVKLPFAVPDPILEAEKERYETLEEYIQSIIVPDMQKKLRQGFGRAIRTEQDTCVVSILDPRAIAGGRYHQEVLCALPDCLMTERIGDVETFIRNRKGEEYYL